MKTVWIMNLIIIRAIFIKYKWNIPLEQFAIIGNPPYNTDPSYNGNKPLYNKFIEKYINGKLSLFVVPSRWFVGGKGLDKFRIFMLKRRDIVFIKHVEDSSEFFGKIVNILGGVNYFLKNSSYSGDCLFNSKPYNLSKYDCIIQPKYHNICNKISNMDKLIQLYYESSFFKYKSNDKRLKTSGKIKCYVSTLKSKDRIKYVDDFEFNEKNSFWKVLTTRASINELNGFGTRLIGRPDEIYTSSYISFRVNNEDEAKSLFSYLDTKFANHMLSIRKI